MKKPAKKATPAPKPVKAAPAPPQTWEEAAVVEPPKPVIVVSSVLAGPPRCVKCGKIEGNHFFKTRHCAPHRDDVYEASK